MLDCPGVGEDRLNLVAEIISDMLRHAAEGIGFVENLGGGIVGPVTLGRSKRIEFAGAVRIGQDFIGQPAAEVVKVVGEVEFFVCLWRTLLQLVARYPKHGYRQPSPCTKQQRATKHGCHCDPMICGILSIARVLLMNSTRR